MAPQVVEVDPEAVEPAADGNERTIYMRDIAIIIILTLVLTGCGIERHSIGQQNEKPIIYASSYPLYFLAHEIGKDNIDLRIVIPAGAEAHDYEPSMKQLKEIGDADLFIYNGAGFESWADRLLETLLENKRSMVASEGVELIEFNGVADPHIWLNPINMITIGENIKENLMELDEQNREQYEQNYKELSDRLRGLDDEYSQALKDHRGKTILVSHAAFDYMAERYGFHQIPVMGINPEQEPSPKAIADIIEIAIEGDYGYIFMEPLISPKTVEVIAREAGLKILVLNPIGGLTKEEEATGEDYISIMKENLKNLEKALVN